jgi:hypothetical protein
MAERDDAITAKVMRALRWGLPVGSIVAAIAVGVLYDTGIAILVLAGGVLLGIIAILWASVRTLAGDTPITLEEAVELGGHSATEEQKRAVLQALKDLDYERSVGKVSDADYEELLRRYRTEAKRLLRAVDEDLAPLRARAQAYVDEHLGRNKAAGVSTAPKAAGLTCSSCQTENDADAMFCKKCGAGMASKDSQNATA